MLKCEKLLRTNSTKSETQIFFAKIEENEHTPAPGENAYITWSRYGNIL